MRKLHLYLHDGKPIQEIDLNILTTQTKTRFIRFDIYCNRLYTPVEKKC